MYVTRVHTEWFLVAAAAVAVYCLVVLASPTVKCRCKPGRERGKCKRCRSYGRRYMPGAVAVHRFFWNVLGHHLLATRKAKIADQLEQFNHEREKTS